MSHFPALVTLKMLRQLSYNGKRRASSAFAYRIREKWKETLAKSTDPLSPRSLLEQPYNVKSLTAKETKSED